MSLPSNDYLFFHLDCKNDNGTADTYCMYYDSLEYFWIVDVLAVAVDGDGQKNPVSQL